jgi:hypothetical protein
MQATMRISVRNDATDSSKGIIADSAALSGVFEVLRNEKTSRVFIYNSVEFWRANEAFVISYCGESFIAGTILNFTEFEALLLEQKAS